MVTVDQYFGKWIVSNDVTPQVYDAATRFIPLVNDLLKELPEGFVKVNPITGTIISGANYGGFRPQNCTVGAKTSSHKEGRGIDIFDPENKIDGFITDNLLAKHGLYREHPDATPLWLHLTDRAPTSNARTFKP